jgi:hypothetical protein
MSSKWAAVVWVVYDRRMSLGYGIAQGLKNKKLVDGEYDEMQR